MPDESSSVLNMRKILALVLTLLLLLAALPCAHAETAYKADLQLDIKPTSNSDGRVVLEISAEVTNGEVTQYIQTLEFRYENDLIAKVDYIGGQSSTYVWSNPLNMSLTGMTEDLEVEVSYIDFDGSSVTTSEMAYASAAEPQVSFKRTASSNAVALGEKIKLTYIVKTEGSVTLLDVDVYDEMPGVGSIGTIDALFPGEMREFTKEVSVEKDVKSEPRIIYTTNNSHGYTTLALEAMNIVVSNPKLTVTLKSDVTSVEAGSSVTLVCSVVNEGNIAFPNVTIADENLGVIIENAQIELGKAYSWNKVIMPVASQNYMFVVKAVDANGKVYTASSNITTVEVANTAVETDGELEVSVTPNTRELAQPGEITFNFLLRNTGTMDVTGVTISDRDGEVLEQINALQPGDKMLPVVLKVEKTGDYYFNVHATLATGTRFQCVTMPVNITVGEVVTSEEPLSTTVIETPAPTSTPAIVINNDRMAGIAPWVIGLIILIALLIVACVVVLLVLQIRAARRRDEEEDEDVYIAPQTQPRRPVQPERDPYDYREEISRVATEYSRAAMPMTERKAEPKPALDDDEEVTVYKARREKEPTTKRN